MRENIRAIRGFFLILALPGATIPVHAELLHYDPFLIGGNSLAGEYALGPLGGQNPQIGPTPFFIGPWGGALDADGATVQSSWLYFRDAPGSGGSVIANDESRNWRDLSAPWDATANGTFYLSFLMNFGGVGLTGDTRDDVGHRAVEMWSADGTAGSDADGVARIGYMSYNGNFNSLPPDSAPLKFGLSIGTEQIIQGGPASFLEDNGRTHLFVLKFNLSNQSASDTVQLFLDPADSDEPIIPSAEFTGIDFTLGSVSGPVQFAGTGSGTVFDEIRIGTEFEDVFPTTPEPGACSGLGESCYLTIIQSMHGVGFDLEGDINHDGRVDLFDLRIWRDNRTDGSPQIYIVPEPGTLVFVFGLVAICCKRN